MNPLAALDRVVAVLSAPWRRLQSEDLVDDIADGLATSGRYVVRVDAVPAEHVLDFSWAARRAGRRLGVCVGVETMKADAADGSRSCVVVAPLRPWPECAD
ncbi:hypothetical protein EFL26_21255 [Nocardioides pocheonensis]|uniref:Uncharacterized protein n=1 Tax=Nocardioides pocheonensis TaxID=661485 RepID=A0A3N0GGY5_9ACTN|nr:hypothetical protein EFL26_21255 [Nocardioides pocheonensis]